MIGERPQHIWTDVDYDDIDGLHEAWRELHGGGGQRKRVAAMNDYDRLLIADIKASGQ